MCLQNIMLTLMEIICSFFSYCQLMHSKFSAAAFADGCFVINDSKSLEINQSFVASFSEGVLMDPCLFSSCSRCKGQAGAS